MDQIVGLVTTPPPIGHGVAKVAKVEYSHTYGVDHGGQWLLNPP
jgi:hypothetical protein